MPGRRFLIALCGVFFLIVVIRTAWLSELSYFTLRTIEHVATGHGFRWNVSDRVLVFDHPLWMLLLLAGRLITGESYYTTLVLSIALSAATAVLVLRSARAEEGILLGAVLLSLSWAFVTFSTSGLEGPLAHLLIVSFCLASIRVEQGSADGRMMAGLAGLAAVTHVATLFITGPALIAVGRGAGGRWVGRRDRCDHTAGAAPGQSHGARSGSTEIGPYTVVEDKPGPTGRPRAGEVISPRAMLAWAGAPLLAWIAIATFYYGSPVPNPVIAEWTEHAGLMIRLQAAARALAFVLRHDPITLASIGAAFAISWRAASPAPRLAFGIILYTLALGAWAGDGMPGRWLALPYLVSTLIIVRHPWIERPPMVAAAVAWALALAAVPALSPIQSDVRFGTPAQFTDPGDPRVRDYPATGFLHDIRQWYPPHHPEATRGGGAWQDTNRAKASPHPAFFGFAAGYGVHVIDRTGRADPLLARLQPEERHVFPAGAMRGIPDGYEASLPDKDNAVRDPALAAYYDEVRLVTRGPLADPRRLIAALRLAFVTPPVLTSRRSSHSRLREDPDRVSAGSQLHKTSPRTAEAGVGR